MFTNLAVRSGRTLPLPLVGEGRGEGIELTTPGLRIQRQLRVVTQRLSWPHCQMTARSKQRARALRQSATDAEQLMWALLRDRRLAGYKFRRQHSIGPYFVDFVSLSEKLVVELDGGQHTEQTNYDGQRTHFLESRGYRVVRYWDHEMLLDPELVLDDVLRHLQTPLPSPRSSLTGRGRA